MKKLIYIVVALLLLASCTDKKEKTESDFYNVQLINKSGVGVEVYNLNDDKGDFPERLTLINGKTHQWKIKKEAVSPLSYGKTGRATVKFDVFYLEYEGDKMQDDIDPRWFENYERLEKDGQVTYQYTFTKEKYQSVVDRNKPDFIQYKCVMVNQSGVKVTFEIRVHDTNVIFPEKLDILPNEKFEWSFESVKSIARNEVKTSPIPPVEVPFGSDPGIAKVTFDGNAVVVYDVYQGRDPRDRDYYVREVIDKENETFTYTFTAEDYQNALNKVAP